jgi:hypothetical protein
MLTIGVDLDIRRKWEKKVLYEVLDTLSDNYSIIRYVFLPVVPLSSLVVNSHEFVTLRGILRQPDGSIISLSTSVDHPEPVPSSCHRSDLQVSGFVIRPLTSSTCAVAYLNQSKLLRKTQLTL